MGSRLTLSTGSNTPILLNQALEEGRTFVTSQRGAEATLRLEAKASDIDYICFVIHIGNLVLQNNEVAARAYIAELAEMQGEDDRLRGDVGLEDETERMLNSETGDRNLTKGIDLSEFGLG